MFFPGFAAVFGLVHPPETGNSMDTPTNGYNILTYIYINVHTWKYIAGPIMQIPGSFCAGLVFRFQLPDQPEAKPWKLARSPSDDILFSGSKDGGGTGGFFIGKSSNWGFPMETTHLRPD